MPTDEITGAHAAFICAHEPKRRIRHAPSICFAYASHATAHEG